MVYSGPADALPGDTCPKCGSARTPLLWAREGDRRQYRCPECGGSWAVDGAQLDLGLGDVAPGELVLA